MSQSKLSTTGKAKSTVSGKSARKASPRKKSTAPVKQKRDSCLTSTTNLESEEPVKSINYREELTYVFFKAAIEHIIESRDTICTEHEQSKATTTTTTSTTEAVPLGQNLPLLPSQQEVPKSNLNPVQQTKRDNRLESIANASVSNKSMTVSRLGAENECDGDTQKKPERKGLEWIEKAEQKIEKIIFKNGNVYEGSTWKWLMHGKGTYVWSDGTVYKGEFKDGHLFGKGKLHLSDLSTYEGDFCKGFFHGTGVFCIASTPTIYKGSWKDGKKDGYGWMLYDHNNWYEGGWCADKKQGLGYRQYKNGSRYKGMWLNDMKNGEGTMVWENADLYTGEWKNDKQNGYGEYTWNAPFTKHFVFPYCNWYKGRWVEGQRHGVGIMNFGSEGGAKLVGTWAENEKHGPGLMLCGNGIIMQCNPLFNNNKPVHLNTIRPKESIICDDEIDNNQVKNVSSEAPLEILDDITTYRKLVKQVKSRVPLESFDDGILKVITQNGLDMEERKYRKLSDCNELQCPLELSIHTNTEEIDLEYYLDRIYEHFYKVGDVSCFKEVRASSQSHRSITGDKRRQGSKPFKSGRTDEEYLIRSVIVLFLPKLTEIYNQYATIMAEKADINSKVILIRLFLWQLLRDIGLPHKGVPLVDVDTFVAQNPKCCLESDHSPFEPIYFWQFIQVLLGSAWLLHLKNKRQSVDVYSGASIWLMFREFLEIHVFPNAGRFVGTCLTEHKDLIPIKCVYGLYAKIGEPHTVFDFLYFTCTKQGKDPPCYTAIDDGDKQPTIGDGKNVTIGENVMYWQTKEEIFSRVSHPLPEKSKTNIFQNSLYIFESLGRRKIIYLLHKICPLVVTHGKLRQDYKLTFLEFYETILLCAYEKAEELKQNELLTKAEPEIVNTVKITSSSITSHKMLKKKKQLKN